MTGPGVRSILWKVSLLVITMSGVVDAFVRMNVGNVGPMCSISSRLISVKRASPTVLLLEWPKE